MTRDRSDAIEIVHRPVTGPPRKDVFEPRSDGRWEHREYHHTGCDWRYAGGEIVEHVSVETPEVRV